MLWTLIIRPIPDPTGPTDDRVDFNSHIVTDDVRTNCSDGVLVPLTVRILSDVGSNLSQPHFEGLVRPRGCNAWLQSSQFIDGVWFSRLAAVLVERR